jgi:hypothetical protein
LGAGLAAGAVGDVVALGGVAVGGVAVAGIAGGDVAAGDWLSTVACGVIVGAIVAAGSNDGSGMFVAGSGPASVTVAARVPDVAVIVIESAPAGSAGSSGIVGVAGGTGLAAKSEQESEARHIPRRAMRRRGCIRQSADKSFTTWII